MALWPDTLPRAKEIHIDWRVLCFGTVVSLLCGVFFGLTPALRVPMHRLEQALRGGGRTVTKGSHRLHRPFVISEIALAVVLLVSAGMLGHTLLTLSSLDPGLDARNVLTARFALPPMRWETRHRFGPRGRTCWIARGKCRMLNSPLWQTSSRCAMERTF